MSAGGSRSNDLGATVTGTKGKERVMDEPKKTGFFNSTVLEESVVGDREDFVTKLPDWSLSSIENSNLSSSMNSTIPTTNKRRCQIFKPNLELSQTSDKSRIEDTVPEETSSPFVFRKPLNLENLVQKSSSKVPDYLQYYQVSGPFYSALKSSNNVKEKKGSENAREPEKNLYPELNSTATSSKSPLSPSANKSASSNGSSGNMEDLSLESRMCSVNLKRCDTEQTSNSQEFSNFSETFQSISEPDSTWAPSDSFVISQSPRNDSTWMPPSNFTLSDLSESDISESELSRSIFTENESELGSPVEKRRKKYNLRSMSYKMSKSSLDSSLSPELAKGGCYPTRRNPDRKCKNAGKTLMLDSSKSDSSLLENENSGVNSSINPTGSNDTIFSSNSTQSSSSNSTGTGSDDSANDF